MLIGAFALFLIALALLWQATKRRKALGLPAGRIIYTDTQGWRAVEKPLFDPINHLVGKPDYLVEEKDQIIPVEVKSRPVSTAPFDAHIYQLAAYCLLVEQHFGKRPPYGILHYPNRTYAIEYSPALESTLLELINEIQQKDRQKEVPRSHDLSARCTRCGFRYTCDQKLL